MSTYKTKQYVKRYGGFWLGLIILTVLYYPILRLNKDMLVAIHDEFDGEFLTYILGAKHAGEHILPEVFNGTLKISMQPPAFLFVVPYLLTGPETAFFFNYLVIALAAYSGMYLCCKRLVGEEWPAVIAGVLFAILPFYSVYGLSVMGQPWLAYAFINLWQEGQTSRKTRLICFAIIILFGFGSSLVLVGYADIIILSMLSVWGACRKRNIRFFLAGLLILAACYVITNIPLMRGVFGESNAFTTHKEEYLKTASPFIDSFTTVFWDGLYYAASNHRMIVRAAEITLLVSIAYWARLPGDEKRRCAQMVALYCLAVAIALLYAIWHCDPVVSLRNKLGGVWVEFQFDRFYWLSPCIWFLMLAHTLHFVWFFLKRGNTMRFLPLLLVIWLNVNYIWNASSLKINYTQWRENEHPVSYASVSEFFQDEMFDEIENYIGQPQESYRVISVGLYPSVALYNGFYCLDGYSNNYDLNYKHAFGSAIRGELDRDEELADYFDNWGNRCYAFSSEIPKHYYIDATKNKHIKTLNYDFDALKAMGCRYILSSVEIDACDALKRLRQFAADTSYYQVILYQIQ